MYGGHLTRVEENGRLFIDNIEVAESRWLKVLRSLLVANAVTLATLLTMIFSDAFIIKSTFDLGCLENLDCYIADSNNTKLLNCSHFINRDEKIACYQFILDFFQAFADAGGVLAVTTLGVVLMTKLWISCGKSRCIRCCGLYICKRKYTDMCVLYICKVVVFTGLVGIVIGMHVLMYLYNRESYTTSRELGLVLKFVAVAISIIITTITPWHVLKQNPAFNITGSLNVKPVLGKNNSLIVNPVPDGAAEAPENSVLEVEGQLDVNPVLKVNGALDEVRLVLKVKGDFTVGANVLKVKGELNVKHENAILTVNGELKVTGELNVNPVLDVSGCLNVTVNETHVFDALNVKIGTLNVKGELKVNRVHGIVSPPIQNTE